MPHPAPLHRLAKSRGLLPWLVVLCLPWLMGMGVGDSQGPTRIPEPRVDYHVALTDQTGVRVELTMFAIEGVDFVLGQVGQGEAAVPFERIARLEFSRQDGQLHCILHLKEGSPVSMTVKPSLAATGRTSYGNYRIPLGEVSLVEFLGRVGPPKAGGA